MFKPFVWILVFLPLLSSCSQPLASTPTPTQAGPYILKVMTHDSFAASEEVIQSFEEEYNATIQFLASGDAGSALNKAILSKGNPLADVLYGLDNTFLSRALEEDIFEPYSSPALSSIPEQFKLDTQNRVIPIDYGDVCLNYDKAYFTEHQLSPPADLDALLAPEYRSLLVVENAATSSPGLAFLLATVGRYGEEGYLDYWQQLKDNDVLVVNDWERAYYTEFSRWGGSRPIVVSYSSSPPFEVIFSETPITEPPTAALVSDNSCFRQVEFAGILKGAQNRPLAEKWIDFMLSTRFQEDIPLQMYVFPVNPAARLDEVFTKYLINPQKTAEVASELIAANRDAWIQAWTEVVLR